jgi:hypothetical protein
MSVLHADRYIFYMYRPACIQLNIVHVEDERQGAVALQEAGHLPRREALPRGGCCYLRPTRHGAPLGGCHETRTGGPWSKNILFLIIAFFSQLSPDLQPKWAYGPGVRRPARVVSRAYLTRRSISPPWTCA